MAQATLGPPRPTRGASGTVGRHWARYRAGYLFLLPALAIYSVFMIYPFFESIRLSFTDWNGATAIQRYVGLANYAAVFRDGLLWHALRNNLIWVILGTIGPIVIGMILALLLCGNPSASPSSAPRSSCPRSSRRS
jgi:ABC-type sugar transport system permease subunit